MSDEIEIDLKKENRMLDDICDELGIPVSSYAPMEVTARYLGVSVRQARHLCQNGNLGEKYGQRTWIITRDELIQFKPNKPALGRPRERKPV